MAKNYLLPFLLFIVGNSIAQTINFSDSNFKSLLLSANAIPSISYAYDENENSLIIDQNSDGEIQVNEAKKVFILKIGCNSCHDTRKISSIAGIENFSNLRVLDISYNFIESVNLASLKDLIYLSINNNKLKEFDFTGLDNLESFNGCCNLFEELDFSKLKKIKQIDCSDNKLVNVNVSGLETLQALVLQNNNLSSLNIINLSNLYIFYGGNNKIIELETKGLSNITDFRCENNLISYLNFSDSNKLSNVICSNNKLEYLSLKNGHFDDYVQFEGNPDLKFVCTDDILNVNNYSEEAAIKLLLNSYNNNYCSVNSYCSFIPGGSFYTIKGTSKYDLDSNGCDESDNNFKSLNFNITDGINKGNIISDATGNYSIAVGEGTHTITPVLQKPSYYNISPSSLIVSFPSDNSPFVSNFCITPKGIHQDLEITILPIVPSRPGFDATYKIVYKNNGTTTQSGSVNLSFNDAVLDYVSSLPTVSNQITDKLTWDYVNLKPFESREIDVVFNVNSPMETPAVNMGDRLSFNALITPVTDDEKPVDNSFAMRQEVVGSFDPND